ncbi:hypothetical protein [Umezawaea sp. Da 62-37]|uniref:hypothetical protein n=1 Tax=Umezawaea sp. Da 62-37 TaxID=3075927 RepID=UPI0028F72D70|nr:hypothetical protein [Umezawaea sp. Da 62-37]WNV90325.1 hypothetical protein RM788_19200 [Umezawaea sp. Da 62-37]
MPASKIQSEQEVLDWLADGKTYQWMVEEYRRKYHIETTISMWSNFRKRRGLETRIARDADLVPWKVKDEHQWSTPLTMLRLLARCRGDFALRDVDQTRLDNWLHELKLSNAVVHYDPDTEAGFFYVPREEGDSEFIRPPSRPQDNS